MKEFTPGSLVLFIEDLSDDILQEGYLLGNAFKESPGEFWSITHDRKIIDNKFYDNYDNTIDYDSCKNIDEIKNIRTNFILEYSDKTILNFNNIVKCLNIPFVRKYTNYPSEIFNFFNGKNSSFRILVKSIKRFFSEPVMIFINVGLVGIIRLIFGGLIDYFINLYKIYKIKKQINDQKRFSYLKNMMEEYTGNHDKSDDDNKLERELTKLEEFRFNIYDTLIALLALVISIISLIISMNKKE